MDASGKRQLEAIIEIARPGVITENEGVVPANVGSPVQGQVVCIDTIREPRLQSDHLAVEAIGGFGQAVAHTVWLPNCKLQDSLSVTSAYTAEVVC
jgi:hypothetical protein